MSADFLDRAARALSVGAPNEALLSATEAARAAPARWEPRLLLARIWLALGHFDRALSDANAALALAKTLPPVERIQFHEVISRASAARRDFETAEKSFRELYRDPAHAKDAARFVGLLAATQRLRDARVIASEAAAIHPGNAERLRKIATAIEKSESPEIEIGELEIDLEMFEEARTRFQRLYAADPADKRVQEALRVINEGGRGRIAKTDPRLMVDAGIPLFRGLGIRLAVAAAFLVFGLLMRCAA